MPSRSACHENTLFGATVLIVRMRSFFSVVKDRTILNIRPFFRAFHGVVFKNGHTTVSWYIDTPTIHTEGVSRSLRQTTRKKKKNAGGPETYPEQGLVLGQVGPVHVKQLLKNWCGVVLASLEQQYAKLQQPLWLVLLFALTAMKPAQRRIERERERERETGPAVKQIVRKKTSEPCSLIPTA